MLVGGHEKTSTKPKAAQGMPPLANGSVGEGLNEPPNSQGLNHVGLLHMHTKGGEKVLMWNKIQSNGNMPLVLGGIR